MIKESFIVICVVMINIFVYELSDMQTYDKVLHVIIYRSFFKLSGHIPASCYDFEISIVIFRFMCVPFSV